MSNPASVDALVEELMALLAAPDDTAASVSQLSSPVTDHVPDIRVPDRVRASEPDSHPSTPAAQAKCAAITRIRFRRFKRLRALDLELGSINILTGANNAGKSTALSALRVLGAGITAAKRSKPTPGQTPDGRRPIYFVPTDGLPVSLENVHSDLADEDTTVAFECEGGHELKLWFPADGGCRLYVNQTSGRTPRTPSAFRDVLPWTIVQVPVLGPLEHNEPLLKEATVRRGLSTHRAARHFRNYWHCFPEEFDRFAAHIAGTWPGMEIERPELSVSSDGSTLHMYCREQRMTRELYWAGFGFQIWCQLLTHVSRAAPGDVLVVDEPETYLHPLVQRALLGVLRATGAQVVLATHSAGIVMSAGPREVIPIDSAKRTARGMVRPAAALASQLGLRD